LVIMFIKVHIQPGAKKNEIVGRHGDAVKIRLKAPPVNGKANEALIAFLAKKLDIPGPAITIKAGRASRQKLLEVNVPETALRVLLDL